MKSCNTILIPVNVLPHFYKYFIDPINLLYLEGARLRLMSGMILVHFFPAGVGFSGNYNQMNYDRLFGFSGLRIPGTCTQARQKHTKSAEYPENGVTILLCNFEMHCVQCCVYDQFLPDRRSDTVFNSQI